LRNEKAAECYGHGKSHAQNRQAITSPRVLEVQEILLAVKIVLEGFLGDAVGLDAG